MPLTSGGRIPREFFEDHACVVARKLLGQRLVRILDGVRLAGVVVETEAYRGEEDLGCHCRHGRTPRTSVMYGPAGFAYVYFTYGMHWMFNIVVERDGFPAAVLIRALLPMEGLDRMAEHRREKPMARWADGPAKLCQALSIDGKLNGSDLCAPKAQLFLEWGQPIPDSRVTTTPRVGLNSVPEPWKSIPWRYLVSDWQADLPRELNITSETDYWRKR